MEAKSVVIGVLEGDGYVGCPAEVSEAACCSTAGVVAALCSCGLRTGVGGVTAALGSGDGGRGTAAARTTGLGERGSGLGTGFGRLWIPFAAAFKPGCTSPVLAAVLATFGAPAAKRVPRVGL